MRRSLLLAGSLGVFGCSSPPPATHHERPGRGDELVSRGEDIFFNETFAGNGRTCSTCHRAERNFTIDAVFAATLPPDDPLFIAERRPSLRKNFEQPAFMRGLGLILENQDGFEDLENNFNLRGVPHTLALRTSVDSPAGPRTGWAGDGSPGDGSLRSFAVGAVIQHFPKTLRRIAGVDFRLPSDDELNALEAFLLSLGRQEDLNLPLPLKGAVAQRGQEIFLDDTLGKCNICHLNAGANAVLGGQFVGNANFNTGVEDLPDQAADLLGELIGHTVPPDDGFGTPGDGTFNTPPLVEAADTGPFFHNGAIDTIEGAVAFYDGDTFNNSPAGKVLASFDPNGVGIRLDATEIVAVAAFLRVINTLENIGVTLKLFDDLLQRRVKHRFIQRRLDQALAETRDAIRVLDGGGLHPEAITHLRRTETLAARAAQSHFARRRNMGVAVVELKKARRLIVQEENP